MRYPAHGLARLPGITRPISRMESVPCPGNRKLPTKMSRNIHGREVVYTTERRTQAGNPGQEIWFSVESHDLFCLRKRFRKRCPIPDLSKSPPFFPGGAIAGKKHE